MQRVGLVLVAALVAVFFVAPEVAAGEVREMANGVEQPRVPAAILEPLAVAPLGPGEIVVVWRVIEDEKGALIVLHVWPGGRELVVAPW